MGIFFSKTEPVQTPVDDLNKITYLHKTYKWDDPIILVLNYTSLKYKRMLDDTIDFPILCTQTDKQTDKHDNNELSIFNENIIIIFFIGVSLNFVSHILLRFKCFLNTALWFVSKPHLGHL